MSTTLSIIILCEVLFTLFIVWGFMHAELFVSFEDKIIFAVLKKIRKRKAHNEMLRREKLNAKVIYTPVRPAAKKTTSNDSAA